MKYYEVDFTITCPADILSDVSDVVAALAGEAGFESFTPSAHGLCGYVQQDAFNAAALDAVLGQLPFDNGVSVTYTVLPADEADWNAPWEQEGFQPIEIGSSLVIHDGRHLPQHESADDTLMIEIDAKLAFGTGNHQTTRLMCNALLDLPLSNHTLLDCGTGTGILSILALMRGASQAVAYDIDEWSTDNTRHNAVINHVDDRLTVLCGDSTVLGGNSTVLGGSPAEVSAASQAGSTTTPDVSPAGFSLVLANINRNILLQDMPRFVSVMAPRATLILSGFYESDCALLESKAQSLGLTLTATKTDGDWACMVFQR
jgi:ribosomal protein L11 methyltransferase